MKHLLIIGGGPAGTAAATTAAARGCRVTLVEKSIVGGAAHLWDCIPSKTMTATAVRIDSIRNAAKLGLVAEPGQVDPQHLAARISKISEDITSSWNQLLTSQSVEIIRGEIVELKEKYAKDKEAWEKQKAAEAERAAARK